MLAKTGVPLGRRVLAVKKVRREILDNNWSTFHEHVRQNRALQVRHVGRKLRHRRHHRGVRAGGALPCHWRLRLCARKGYQPEKNYATVCQNGTKDFHERLLASCRSQPRWNKFGTSEYGDWRFATQ